MSLQTEFQLASRTWQFCQQLLPPDLAAKLTAHPKDPRPLDKKGLTQFVAQLRILPIKPIPKEFWDANWSFYQILVGALEGSLGGVQFLQFSNKDKFRKHNWVQPVSAILRDLERQRPSDFHFSDRNDRGAIKPQLCTRYQMKPWKFFPVEQAAKDLAWLIEQSFPHFCALNHMTPSRPEPPRTL